MSKNQKNDELFAKYLNTWAGKNVLQKYSLKTFGKWKVTGEDPNCEFGGYHHNPTIGYFDGVLEDVIRFAIEDSSFWQWGGGGNFELLEPKIVTESSWQNRSDLIAERKRLQEQIDSINKQLGVK